MPEISRVFRFCLLCLSCFACSVGMVSLDALGRPGCSRVTAREGAGIAFAGDPAPPQSLVKLIFIHHSTGENWLNDDHGRLGIALRDNNYFVSDTNYGWGPEDEDTGDGTIGDHTDIGHWYNWFSGPHRNTYTSALYQESSQHSDYSRLASDPGGPNQVILFKSCFPNSHLGGSPADTVPSIYNNPLRGRDSSSEEHTIANAKGIYIELLNYFASRPDKLFVVITAPPLVSGDTDSASAANARAFNNWLVNNWLSNYSQANVAVFDFYNVLTSNGGSTRINNPNLNDLGSADGNHHRWYGGAIQHLQTVNNNYSAYASSTDDSHPTAAGGVKASGEFAALLNFAYNRWRSTSPNLTATASVSPSTVAPGGTVLMVVAITPGTNPTSTGLAVSGDLSAIGGAASQQFYNDGTHGDATAGDNRFSYQAAIPANTSVGSKSIAIAVTDAQGRSATTTVTLEVASAVFSAAQASLIFPQVADGGGYVSNFLLTNATDTSTTATLSFFSETGTPLSIMIGGVSSTTRDVPVPAHGSAKLTTSGLPSAYIVGWVRVTTNPNVALGGNAVFQLFNGSTLFSEASVPGVLPVSKIDFFADEDGGFKTGFALANPGNLTAGGTLTLFYKDGTQFGTYPISVPPGNHTAVFLWQLFGANAPSGRAEISLTSGYLAATALRYHTSSIFSTVSVGLPGFAPGGTTALFSPNGGVRDRLVAEINKARSTIDIAIYSFTADVIRDALIAARNRGVTVRIIADSSQATGYGSEVATLEALGFNLRRISGISGGIMHNKFMIIDGAVLFTGSYDWSASAETDNLENALFLTGATTIRLYQAEFEAIWVR